MAPRRRVPPPPTRFAIASAQPSTGTASTGWKRPSAPPPPPTAFAGGAHPQRQGRRQAPPKSKPPSPAVRAVQRMETPGTTTSPPGGTRARSGSAPPALNSPNFKASRRVVIKCTMGQGVVGHLGRVVLVSDQFSSCSPIVMFNAQTGMGGLFHFAADNWKQQPDALKVMFQSIRPTVIYLCDRTTATDRMLGQPGSTDYLLQDEFFREACGYTGEIKLMSLKSQQYCVTLGADGGLTITAASPGATFDVSSNEWEQVNDSPLSDVATSYAMEDVTKIGKNLW
jgi:hypothetical protein